MVLPNLHTGNYARAIPANPLNGASVNAAFVGNLAHPLAQMTQDSPLCVGGDRPTKTLTLLYGPLKPSIDPKGYQYTPEHGNQIGNLLG